MNAKKIILIIMLVMAFSLAIGGVSAVKYIDWCDGGDKKHKTTWNKQLYSKENQGIVIRNGKEYTEILNYHEKFVLKCNHNSHKYKPYQSLIYEPDWANGKLVYSYKLAKWKKFYSTTITTRDVIGGYSHKISFVCYNDDFNNVKYKLYLYRLKDNKKELDGTSYFTKNGDAIKSYSFSTTSPPDYTNTYYYKFGGNAKQFCRYYIANWDNPI